MGIAYLFEDRERTIETREWYSLLSESPDLYKNCVVKTVTHVKNLRSNVVHEYLQAIIEDLDTGKRTRLIAERQTGQDQVIIGRWASKKSSIVPRSSSSSSSSSSDKDPSGDLPLPLCSLTFGSDNLKVLDFAKILAQTTDIGGKYNLLTKNCYWFAFTVYKALSSNLFQGRERTPSWPFSRWRGCLILFKKSAEGNANEFEQERNDHMRWAPGTPALTWRFLEEAYKSAIRLEADSSQEADKVIEDNLTKLIMTDMDKNKTLSTMKNVQVPESLSSDLGLDEAYKQAQGLERVSEYIDVYHRHNDQQRVGDVKNIDDEGVLVPENFAVQEPTQEETEKLHYVIQVMVGEILSDFQPAYT